MYHSTDYTLSHHCQVHLLGIFFTASLLLSFEAKGESQHLFPLIYRIKSTFSVILSSISLAIIKLYKIRLLGQFFQKYILYPKSSRVICHPCDIIACTTNHFYPLFFHFNINRLQNGKISTEHSQSYNEQSVVHVLDLCGKVLPSGLAAVQSYEKFPLFIVFNGADAS